MHLLLLFQKNVIILITKQRSAVFHKQQQSTFHPLALQADPDSESLPSKYNGVQIHWQGEEAA